MLVLGDLNHRLVVRQRGRRLRGGGEGEVAGLHRDRVALHQRLGADVIALLLGQVEPVAERRCCCAATRVLLVHGYLRRGDRQIGAVDPDLAADRDARPRGPARCRAATRAPSSNGQFDDRRLHLGEAQDALVRLDIARDVDRGGGRCTEQEMPRRRPEPDRRAETEHNRPGGEQQQAQVPAHDGGPKGRSVDAMRHLPRLSSIPNPGRFMRSSKRRSVPTIRSGAAHERR